MKQGVLVLAIVLLSAIGGVLAKAQWDGMRSDSVPTPTFQSQITTKSDLALVSQAQHFTDQWGFYKVRPAGETRYLYTSISNQDYGVKIPKDWDWKFEHRDRVVKGVAPPLEYFGPNVDLSQAEFHKIESGFFVDETEAMITLHQRIKDASWKAGEATLTDPEVARLAKLSLEDRLLGLLQQANPDLGILKVDISFHPTPDGV